SNSKFVQSWIQKNYKRESIVIYPPVNLNSFLLESNKQDFYVIAGRMAIIKRFDLVIKAFNKNGKRLIVIGDGNELSQLKKLAVSPSIEFLGFQNVNVLSEYLQKAKAFIQMGVEGFGIAAIEAQSCGTPVICYKKGGIIETVIENKTGLFFSKQSVSALNKTIEKFERLNWDYEEIHKHAQKFSAERFEKEIKNFIMDKTKIRI